MATPNSWGKPNEWTPDSSDYSNFQYELREYLKKKLPEFQQNSGEPIDGFVESSGELFDEIRTAIHTLSGYLNWNDAPLETLDILGKSFGFSFPRNLDESTRRTIVRDVVNIYKRNGTPDTFRWIFKIIGWDVELQFAWVRTPDDLLKGKEKIIYDGSYVYDGTINYSDSERVDLSNLTFRDLLYGEARDEADGVFFYGKKYFESDPETFKKIPIQGEKYPNYRVTEDDTYVASTPYVIVRITEEDYRLFTEPYTDPDTGVEYSYTESEKFKIADELVNFLLYEQGRPVQVRVILIVTDQQFSDDIPDVTDTYDETWTAEPYEFDDPPPDVDSDYNELINVGKVVIGDTHKIGEWTNPYSRVMMLSGLRATSSSQTLTPVAPDTENTINIYIPTGQVGNSREFLIRYGTELTFTVPAGSTFELYGTEQIGEPYVLIDTYTAGQNVNITLNDYHLIYFNITGALSDEFVGQIKYTKLTQ